MAYCSVNSPIAKKAVASLKRIEASRKAALESEPISRQQDQPTASDIQVTATAGPSTRALSPQKDTGSVVPSSASAKITDQKAAEPPQDDSLRPQEMDDEDELIMTDSVSHLKEIGRQVFSRQAKQQAESNKENIEFPMAQVEPQSGIRQKRRFIDRQPNAQRVEFDNTQESDGNFQPSQIEDVSEDEGFQTSHQIVNVAARRRLKPSQEHPASQPTRPQGPARKRARIQETGPPGTLDVIPDRMNDEPSPSSLLEVYKVANSAAKERTNLQPRLPQIRRPWSDEETSQLLDLIEDHGISWSLLKKEDQEGGGLLQDRDQVALKDKARNMKVDYLRYVNIKG